MGVPPQGVDASWLAVRSHDEPSSDDKYVWDYTIEEEVTFHGDYSDKIGWGCAASFPQPLPYLWPKSAIFLTLFMTWPKIRNPIYNHCGWRSCLKLKLWRAFLDILVENKEKVASSKKYSQLKTRVLKPYPIYDQNGQNRYPIYDQNDWKTLLFGAAHTYIAHMREYPPRSFCCCNLKLLTFPV